MAIPLGKSFEDVLREIRNQAQFSKLEAQNAMSALSSAPVSADWIFQFLIQMRNFIDATQSWVVSGLDAYASANMPNYSGSITSDIANAKTQAQACITWVVNNFPKDAQGFMQAYTMNADGTLTPANFTVAQTAGLRNALNNFIAAIS